MAEKTTVARPYARAVFEIARDSDTLSAWSDFLERAKLVVADERIHELIGNPAISRHDLGDLLIELCGDAAGEQGANFIKLLAENGRVAYVPEIAAEFEELKAEAENVVDVTITSAVPLDDDQRGRFAASLRQRLGRDVRLHLETDSSLIGGAVVRAGDLVIDGSVRGRLQRLSGAVTH
ncbi:MAG: F0F1 ATP synthase subunit delta [Gammaproteobacteria bacterium]